MQYVAAVAASLASCAYVVVQRSQYQTIARGESRSHAHICATVGALRMSRKHWDCTAPWLSGRVASRREGVVTTSVEGKTQSRRGDEDEVCALAAAADWASTCTVCRDAAEPPRLRRSVWRHMQSCRQQRPTACAARPTRRNEHTHPSAALFPRTTAHTTRPACSERAMASADDGGARLLCVAVVGAGIAGLAVALALVHEDVVDRVGDFESAGSPRLAGWRPGRGRPDGPARDQAGSHCWTARCHMPVRARRLAFRTHRSTGVACAELADPPAVRRSRQRVTLGGSGAPAEPRIALSLRARLVFGDGAHTEASLVIGADGVHRLASTTLPSRVVAALE